MRNVFTVVYQLFDFGDTRVSLHVHRVLLLRADRFFELDASAPVGHCLDQMANLLARLLVTQILVLVEESGCPWHEDLRIGYHDGTDATERPT